jgi:hypothetical protein
METDYLKITQKRSRAQTFKKWFKRIFFTLIILVVGAGVLIKFDAPLAANIADNYLRPIVGDKTVIFIENIFFNISDEVDKVVYQFKSPISPQFLDQSKNLTNQLGLDLTPIKVNSSFDTLSGEGVWNNLESTAFPNTEAMASTFIRPDSNRSFAMVSVVQINTKLVGIASIAGTKEPGGSLGNFGTGIIPQSVIDNGSLVAAFNGGFLYNDGKYGMIIGDKTYVPLKIGVGTLVAYTDGTVKLFNYTGDNLGNNVVFARQNGPLIIDNSEKATLSPTDYKKVQGRIYNGKEIVPDGTFTWRSGLGVTKTGNLLYAVGNNLSPESLANALQAAGAVTATQLDINPSHIHFYIFNKTETGEYKAIFLNKDLQRLNKSAQYLTGTTRDFFYLYKR